MAIDVHPACDQSARLAAGRGAGQMDAIRKQLWFRAEITRTWGQWDGTTVGKAATEIVRHPQRVGIAIENAIGESAVIGAGACVAHNGAVIEDALV